MNLRLRRLMSYSVFGALSGMGLLIVFVMGLVMLRGSPRRDSIDWLFALINRPIEFLPWAGELAEQQDPVLSFGVMVAYWGLLGVLGANIICLVKNCYRPR